MRAELAFKTGSTYIEELHVRYSGLPGNTWVQLGLDDLFIAKYDRKTEAEVLAETAFYRSDDMGLQIGGEPNNAFYWRLSVSNGLTLGSKGPSEDGGYPLIHDARNTSNSSTLMTGLGLGYKFSLGGQVRGDILPFYYSGGISEEDVSYLQSINGYESNSNSKERFGSNFRFDIYSFTFIAQILQAKDGDFDRSAWFVQPSYTLSQRYELVYRYMELDIDIAPYPSETRTWDRQQHVFSVVSTITNNFKIKTEYYINDEKTSSDEIDNDEFLIQFEFKF